MAFDAEEFFRDNAVNVRTEGHKHCRPGWINMPCPFCTGNPGYHLGYNLSADFFRCWRCGFHSITEVVREIAGVPWGKAKDLTREYWTGSRSLAQDIRKRAAATELKFPSGTEDLSPRHLSYLTRRGFKAVEVRDTWRLLATGPTGPYRHRIIAPIRYNRRLVSYQGRDFTGKQREPYKACAIEEEVINHKEILYGLDEVPGREVILVEGITDVWRLGPGAVAGFGIEMKQSQILLLAEKFRKVFVMFDDDPQAVKKAWEISSGLSMVGVDTEICLIEGDPGALEQRKADEYVRQLIGRKH